MERTEYTFYGSLQCGCIGQPSKFLGKVSTRTVMSNVRNSNHSTNIPEAKSTNRMEQSRKTCLKLFYTLWGRWLFSSDRNSGKMFPSGAVDGKTLWSPMEIFKYHTRKSSSNRKCLWLLKLKHLHVPVEGIKLLPAGTPPSAFTDNDTLGLTSVKCRKTNIAKFPACHWQENSVHKC